LTLNGGTKVLTQVSQFLEIILDWLRNLRETGQAGFQVLNTIVDFLQRRSNIISKITDKYKCPWIRHPAVDLTVMVLPAG
jgi:hypothetical protein